MDSGFWLALLGLVVVIAWFLVETIGPWSVGGWMEYRDRRATRTREKAEADLAEYGPTALGLRDELLPEDPRQMVRGERVRAQHRWGKWVPH